MKLLAQNPISVPIGSTFLGNNTVLQSSSGLSVIIGLVVRISFVVSGIFILFFIVFAGINIIAGAGSNNPEAAKKGREALTTAIIGFVVVFAAYWIVRLIEAITGVLIIS